MRGTFKLRSRNSDQLSKQTYVSHTNWSCKNGLPLYVKKGKKMILETNIKSVCKQSSAVITQLLTDKLRDKLLEKMKKGK